MSVRINKLYILIIYIQLTLIYSILFQTPFKNNKVKAYVFKLSHISNTALKLSSLKINK